MAPNTCMGTNSGSAAVSATIAAGNLEMQLESLKLKPKKPLKLLTLNQSRFMDILILNTT